MNKLLMCAGLFSLSISTAFGSFDAFLEGLGGFDEELARLSPYANLLKDEDDSQSPKIEDSESPEEYTSSWYYNLGLEIKKDNPDSEKFLSAVIDQIHKWQEEDSSGWDTYKAYYWMSECFYENFPEGSEVREVREARAENLDFSDWVINDLDLSLEEFEEKFYKQYPNCPRQVREEEIDTFIKENEENRDPNVLGAAENRDQIRTYLSKHKKCPLFLPSSAGY